MITDKLRFVENTAQTLSEQKSSLRAYMKKRRSDTVNRDVKEELLVENFFKALEETGLGQAETFFVYLAFSSEAPTDKLIETLIARGKRVYCPRTENGELAVVEYGEDFTLSDFGIREPLGEPYDGVIDVAVIPLLAADELGNRLGYGKGYYDKYLKTSSCKRIGYCFDFQVIKKVPADVRDEKLALLVTDEKIVYIK